MSKWGTRTCPGFVRDKVVVECGTTFEARADNHVRCKGCNYQHTLSQRRIRYHRGQERAVRTGARGHGEARGPRGEPMKPKEAKCNTCGSQPHACEPGRFAEPRSGVLVEIAPNWQCITCGLAYAPLPPVSCGPLVRSSMGMTARHGEYHGLPPGHYTPGVKAIGDKAYRRKTNGS